MSANTEKVTAALARILKNIEDKLNLKEITAGPLKANPYSRLISEKKWNTDFFLKEYLLIQEKKSSLSSSLRQVIVSAVSTAIYEVAKAEHEKKEKEKEKEIKSE